MCLVVLEMSVERIMQRLVQSWFGLAQGDADAALDKVEIKKYTYNENAEDGPMVESKTTGHETLVHPKLRKRITPDLQRVGTRFLCRHFSPTTLTVNALTGYLDELEAHKHYQPDVLIIDYPDLMQHNQERLRSDLENTYQRLRALAIERECAVVVASQSNRSSMTRRQVTLAHVAESVGKVHVSDHVVTYSQTDTEHAIGFARLFVAKSRYDRSHFMVLLSQSYANGQFCVSALPMPGRTAYFDAVGSDGPDDDGEERDD